MQCSVDDCTNKVLARGLCSGHYKRWQTGATTTGPVRKKVRASTGVLRNADGDKYCSENHWTSSSNFSVNNQVPDKLQSTCKYHVAVHRAEKLYNLPVGGWATLLEQQDNKCAVCKIEYAPGGRQWHVDHDHKCCSDDGSCGKCVRGIICPYCNWGLGAFGDNVNTLLSAVQYLEEHEIIRTTR